MMENKKKFITLHSLDRNEISCSICNYRHTYLKYVYIKHILYIMYHMSMCNKNTYSL